MEWTHVFCNGCYADAEPGRTPVRMTAEFCKPAPCCKCGVMTDGSLFYRHDPATLACGGKHEEEDDGLKETTVQ